MTATELHKLDVWIFTHVMGWVEFREEEYPHRNGFSKGDEYGGKCLEADMPEFSTEPAAVMQVLEKCLEKVSTASIEIYQGVDEAPEYKRGFCITMADMKEVIDAETLPLAICLFAKKLFSK